MWPFKSKPKPTPSIRCGDTLVTWNRDWSWWEFTAHGVDFRLAENPEFDVGLLKRLAEVLGWAEKLDSEIDAEVSEHLTNWCDSMGDKELVSVDISGLVAENEARFAYAHDDWGDLGVDVVVRAGVIVDSYAGD